MNENISRQEFIKQVSQMTRGQRVEIANELYHLIFPRLRNELIPGEMRKHISDVWNHMRVSNRISNWNLWKLWVFGMKPTGDLKNWRMTGKQCYRLQPRITGNRHHVTGRPRTDQSRTRRPTIRDCNNDAVPRRWLDRFAPHIKTQADWDANSIYKK